MNFNQFNIIAALKQYKENERPDVQPFNQEGVCISLAMCFARAHLVEPSAIESPEIFEDFLLKWQTKEGVKSFFDEYELLKNKMLQSKRGLIELSTEGLQELAMNLAKLETQMAYYNTAVMLYAQTSSDYYIGLEHSYHLRTLQFAGLDFTGGGAAFAISPDELDLFFFAQDSESPTSIISPFSAGGTYVLRVPGHACALSVAKNGDITFYDPNRQSYITSREDVELYKTTFKAAYTLENGVSDKVEVLVYAVDLLDKTLGKNNSQQYVEGIKAQLNKATERLVSQFDIQNTPCLTAPNFWKNLFFNRTPFSERILKKIMMEWGNNPQLRGTILSAALTAFKETRNSELFDIVLKDASITQAEFNNMLSRANSHEYGGHAMSYLIAHTPTHLSLFPDNQIVIRNSLKAALTHPAERFAQPILEALFEKNGANLALNELLTLNDLDISSFAIEYWARLNISQGRCSALVMNGVGLINYMIQNNFPEKNILMLLRSQSYILSQDDYDALLKSQYQQAKKALLDLAPNNFLPGVRLASPLTQAVLTENMGLARELLLTQSPMVFSLEDKTNAVICAVTSGNQDLLSLVLESLDNNEDKNVLGSKALALSLLSGNNSLAIFLIEEMRLRILPADENLVFSIPENLIQAIKTGNLEALSPWFALSQYQPEFLNIPKNSQGQSFLILAIKFQQYAIVQELLNSGASTLQADFNGLTPLITAVQVQNLELVETLSQKDGLDATDKFGFTATMYALQDKNTKILEVLLGKNPNLQKRSNSGSTALILAARSSPEALKLLLAQGLNNLNEVDSRGNTALMHAIMRGECDSAKILIEKGALLELSDSQLQIVFSLTDVRGNTLLMQAMAFFDIELAETLINAGASCDIVNTEGESTVLLGVEHAFELVPLILTQASPQAIDAVSRNGDFPLGVVSSYKGNNKLKVLLAAGANVCTTNLSGETALMIAASSGGVPICEELLLPQYQHSFNMQDIRGNTALMKAVLSINKAVEKVQLFLETGAVDLSLSNSQGRTALMIAATAPINSHKLVRMILEKSQREINNIDKDGNTALMLAIQKNNIEAVKALIDAGSDLYMTNHLGKSALDLASSNHVYGSDILAALEGKRSELQTRLDSVEGGKPDSLFTRPMLQLPEGSNPGVKPGA